MNTTHRLETITNQLTHTDTALWALASLFFITGDTLSTQHALLNGAKEANPIVRHIIHTHGFNTLILLKTTAILLIIALWLLTHYSVALAQQHDQHPLDARIKRALPHPLDTLYSSLPNDPITHNPTALKIVPALPLLVGLYLTINNTLVIMNGITLHNAIAQSLLHLT